MTDITRLSRFVGGLPRDIDITTNSLQVFSLKVGTTSPVELTQAMTTILDTTTNGGGLPAANLSAAAKQATLESKLAAMRVGVLNYVPTTGNTSDVVTTPVLAAATTDTPIGTGSGIAAASAKGIFVGTVGGAADIGKVLIRVHGTDNGFDDGTGDEIYGVLSESGGVYTLAYKTAAGSAYTILSSDATSKFDFYFIEVMDLYSFGVDRLLMPAIGGVVDATTASSVYTEHTARVNADSTLQANINAEITARTDGDNFEITARSNADSTLQSNINSEVTARINADSTLTSNLNSEITARSNADSTLTSNLNSEITARANADSTLQSNLNSEITARSNADSSLQAELNLTQGSLGNSIDGTGAWVGFSGTHYLDAELTVTTSLTKLDTTLYGESTARANADSTLQSNLNSEITARSNADSTLTSNLNSEITARSNADSTLTSNLNSEITARINADSTIQSNSNSEITARQDADSTLQANINSEITARANADSTLQSNLNSEITSRSNADSTLTSNLNSEITARSNADSTLQSNLNSEITARSNADSTLTSNLNSEITSRSDADSTLQSNINSEITSRTNADSTLQSNIDSEITARSNADSTLTSNLNSEITARSNADSTLTSNLNSEITARSNADSTLQSELDLTQGSLGSAINGSGAWVGFSGTTYLDSELTFTAAFESLDSHLASILTTSVDVSFVAATGGIAAGDVVALSLATGGVVIKANATGIATCESVVGVALETKTAGNAVLVRTFGDATVTTDGTNFDLGKRVYAHTNAGQATKTPPASANNVVYLLGGATATNKVFVNTNLEYVVT